MTSAIFSLLPNYASPGICGIPSLLLNSLTLRRLLKSGIAAGDSSAASSIAFTYSVTMFSVCRSCSSDAAYEVSPSIYPFVEARSNLSRAFKS